LRSSSQNVDYQLAKSWLQFEYWKSATNATNSRLLAARLEGHKDRIAVLKEAGIAEDKYGEYLARARRVARREATVEEYKRTYKEGWQDAKLVGLWASASLNGCYAEELQILLKCPNVRSGRCRQEQDNVMRYWNNVGNERHRIAAFVEGHLKDVPLREIYKFLPDFFLKLTLFSERGLQHVWEPARSSNYESGSTSSDLAIPKKPNLHFVPVLVLGALLFLTFVVCGGLGIWSRFWRDNMFMLLLICSACVSTLLITLASLFQVTGYQYIGLDPSYPVVSEVAVGLLNNLGDTMTLLVFAFFTIVLLESMVDAFFEGKVSNASIRIAVGSVAFICGGYSVAMAVVSAQPSLTFVFDASLIVTTSGLLLLGLVLSIAFGYVVWRLKSDEDARWKHSRVYLVVACVICVFLLVSLVLLCLSLFEDELRFGRPAFGLKFAAYLFTYCALAVYGFLALKGSVLRKKASSHGGYVEVEMGGQ
jgi:hypothetical protein